MEGAIHSTHLVDWVDRVEGGKHFEVASCLSCRATDIVSLHGPCFRRARPAASAVTDDSTSYGGKLPDLALYTRKSSRHHWELYTTVHSSLPASITTLDGEGGSSTVACLAKDVLGKYALMVAARGYETVLLSWPEGHEWPFRFRGKAPEHQIGELKD